LKNKNKSYPSKKLSVFYNSCLKKFWVSPYKHENDMLSIKLDPVEALIPSNQTQNNPKQHNR